MIKVTKKNLAIFCAFTFLMIVWRIVFKLKSERYYTTPILFIVCLSLYFLFTTIKKSNSCSVHRSVIAFIFFIETVILVTLLPINRYKDANITISDIIKSKAESFSNPVILVNNKHIERYSFYSNVESINGHYDNSSFSALMTYFSALSYTFDTIFVIWDSKIPRNESKRKDHLSWHINNSEWKELFVGYASNNKKTTRYLYQFSPSEKTLSRMRSIDQPISDNLIINGDMEKPAGPAKFWIDTLGTQRGLPHFKDFSFVLPYKVDLWVNLSWMPGSDGIVYSKTDHPLQGKSSLYLSGKSNLTIVTRDSYAFHDGVFSFIYKGSPGTHFRVVLFARKEDDSWLYTRSPNSTSSFISNGKVQPVHLLIYQSFMPFAKKFRIGIEMDKGELILDDLEWRTFI